MDINLQLLDYNCLLGLSSSHISGRLLSINIGKKICVGIIALCQGYALYNYSRQEYEVNPIKRGDLITFRGTVIRKKGKSILQVKQVIKRICCKGALPNDQFKRENDIHRIIPVMFMPECNYLIKLKSSVTKHIRLLLYENNFDEIQTPVLFNKKSPSNALCFSVTTVSGTSLFLKSIHEHLLKPYLLVGFDRIFEIGSVFRNIKYSHQFDCEFSNIDIWMKQPTLTYLIQLCVSISQSVRTIQGLPPLEEINYEFDTFVMENRLDPDNYVAIKHFIKKNFQGKLITLRHYPRIKNFHTKPTIDKLHNEEFHAFANGLSYAHGYIVDIEDTTNNIFDDEHCYLFEEYLQYGIDEFGGLGIGLEKLIQSMLNIDDYHMLNLYRRKY